MKPTKLTAKIVSRQSKEIKKFLVEERKNTIKKLKQKWPELLGEITKHWNTEGDTLLSPAYYTGLEDYIPVDTSKS